MTRSGPAPAALGWRDPVDPDGLEPGVILWERFCVLGPAERDQDAWRVSVSDLKRELGLGPHHRMELQHLATTDEAHREKVLHALDADTPVQPRVFGSVATDQGVAVLFERVSGAPLLETRHPVARSARSVVGLVRSLRATGFTGAAVDVERLRVQDGQCRVSDFRHLRVCVPEQDTLSSLLALLRRIDVHAELSDLLDEAVELDALDESIRTRAHVSQPPELPDSAPFVGRQDLLAQLRGGLDDAEIARPRCFVVTGPPGSGKTRLLDELESQARHRENLPRVLRVSDMPAPAETAFARALGRLPSEVLPDEVDRTRGRLMDRTRPFTRLVADHVPALAPMLGYQAPPPDVALHVQRDRLLTVLADAICSIGTRARPLLLIIDDFRGADAGTRRLLQRVMERPRGHHTCVVVTADVPLDFPLRRTEDLPLPPLPVEAVLELAQAVVGAESAERAARRLHERFAGHTLLTWAALCRTATVSDEALVAGPTSLREHHGQAIAELDAMAREVALTIAVHVDGGDEQWVRRVRDISEDDVGRAVGRLLELGVCVRDERGHLVPSHPSMRALLLETRASWELRRAHALVADWAAEREGDPSQIAFHRICAAEPGIDQVLAVEGLERGRAMLASGNPASAVWFLQAALERTDDRQTLLGVRESLADACLLEGEIDRAIEHFEWLVAHGDPNETTTATAARAVRALSSFGAHDAARTVGAQCLAHLGRPLPHGWNAMRRALGRGWGAVRSPDLPESMRCALARLYEALAASCEDPRESELCALEGFRHSSGLRTSEAAFAMIRAAAIAARDGRATWARETFRETAQLVEELDDESASAALHLARAEASELPEGRYRRGQESLDAAIRAFRKTGDLRGASLAYFVKASYGRDREANALVTSWLDTGLELAGRQRSASLGALHRSLRTLMRARVNVASLETLERARATALSDVPRNGHRLWILTATIEALVEAKDAQAAKPLVDRVRAEVARQPSTEREAEVALTIALYELESGASRTAVWKALRRASGVTRRRPRLRARLQLLQLRAMLQWGRLRRANSVGRALIESAPTHGQTRLVEQAHRMLALAAPTPGSATLPSVEYDLPGSIDPGSSTDRSGPPLPRAASVAHMIGAFKPRVSNLVGPTVEVQVDAAPQTSHVAASRALTSLLFHLTVTSAEAVRGLQGLILRGRLDRPEEGLSLEVEATGARVLEEIPGLAGCAELAGRLGGTVSTERTDTTCVMSARIPTEGLERTTRRRPREGAAFLVLHGDVRLRRTITGTLRRLGMLADERLPRSELQPDAEYIAVFADASTIGALADRHPGFRWIEVAARGAVSGATELSLEVPHDLAEFEALLRELGINRGSDAPAPASTRP